MILKKFVSVESFLTSVTVQTPDWLNFTVYFFPIIGRAGNL